jgi:hypothetical protein
VARDKTPLEQAVTRTVVREVTIPAGTELPIVLDTSVGSKTSHVEESVRAHLSRAVSVGGQAVLADGSTVSGVVTDATPSAKVRTHLAVRFDSITPRGGDEYRMETAAIGRTAPSTRRRTRSRLARRRLAVRLSARSSAAGKAQPSARRQAGAGTAVVLSTSGKGDCRPAPIAAAALHRSRSG